MRITVSVPGRFQPAYVWAEFLEGVGHLERLVTPLPHFKMAELGPSRGATRSLLPVGAWNYGFRRLGRRLPLRTLELNQRLTLAAFDWAASQLLGPCDVFNGWSGASLASMRVAHRNGVPTVLQTGSAHILTQRAILTREAAKFGQDAPIPQARGIRRALAEYDEADVIVVPSAFVYGTFLDHGVPRDKIITVPWAAVRVAPPAALPIVPGETVTVLFVGGCTLRKGMPYLLDAARRLRGEAVFRLVGVENAELVTRLGGLPQNVTAVGVRRGPALREEFQRADIFVLPSVEDGSALVTLEAMLAGLPVVVSDHAGAALVTDGASGFVVPACDSASLAERLLLLVRDANLRVRMGDAARAAAEPRTSRVYGEELCARVYRPLMARGPARPYAALRSSMTWTESHHW